MSFLKAIENRYTTKVYDSAKKIEESKIQELKEVLRLSPSSINSQPWEFVFVQDVATKETLSKVSQHNHEKVMNCDTVVVFRSIDNLTAFSKELKERLPEYAYEFYRVAAEHQSEDAMKEWMTKQVYIALGMFLSACAALGVDATPMEGIESEAYDKIVGNTDFKTVLAVAIGQRDAEDFNQPSKKPKIRKALNQVVRTL
ncbi:nitroreductase family protein [Ochrovirga pacifica]|uniref:nitroreductase family protein n=1 Tax=Ochrovirga pacifica TaxID=1042376 RepID=UPI000255878C|nr:nitroreductase family protein [Ochrovirga pacifica]